MSKQIYLITGGAGFIGSHMACRLKQTREDITVIALDNLKRRGAEFNLPKLHAHGVRFIHGDIRNMEDLRSVGRFHYLIDCSAEPSVLAGYQGAGDYVINTNLLGTINCLELARGEDAGFIFLSTSRVYPLKTLNAINRIETATRFEIASQQNIPGVTPQGISEDFPMAGARTLYGTTKLCSELILQEYADAYGCRGVINRCGLVTGPGQMPKTDQGVVALWVTHHVLGRPLRYIGFGGTGKQVRDMLHVEDLFVLVNRQIEQLSSISGEVYNVGGGRANTVSLVELTDLCREATGADLPAVAVAQNRQGDIPVFVTDARRVMKRFSWKPRIECRDIIGEQAQWVRDNTDIFRSLS